MPSRPSEQPDRSRSFIFGPETHSGRRAAAAWLAGSARDQWLPPASLRAFNVKTTLLLQSDRNSFGSLGAASLFGPGSTRAVHRRPAGHAIAAPARDAGLVADDRTPCPCPGRTRGEWGDGSLPGGNTSLTGGYAPEIGRRAAVERQRAPDAYTPLAHLMRTANTPLTAEVPGDETRNDQKPDADELSSDDLSGLICRMGVSGGGNSRINGAYRSPRRQLGPSGASGGVDVLAIGAPCRRPDCRNGSKQ